MDTEQKDLANNTKINKKREKNKLIKKKAREKALAEHERVRSGSESNVQNEDNQQSARKSCLFKKAIIVNSNGSCNMKDLIDKIMDSQIQEKYVKLVAKNNSITKCVSVLEIIKRKINTEQSDIKQPIDGHLNEHVILISQKNEKDDLNKDAVMEVYQSYV